MPGLLGRSCVVPRTFGPFVVGSRVIVPPDAPLRLLLGDGEVADAVDCPLKVHLLDHALLLQLARPGGGLVAAVLLCEVLGECTGEGLRTAVPFGGVLSRLPGEGLDAGLGCEVLGECPGEGLGVSGVLGEHLGEDLGAGLVAVVLLGGLPVGGPVVAVLLLKVLGRGSGGVLSW